MVGLHSEEAMPNFYDDDTCANCVPPIVTIHFAKSEMSVSVACIFKGITVAL